MTTKKDFELLLKLKGNYLIVNNQWWNKSEPLYMYINDIPHQMSSKEIFGNKGEESIQRVSMEDFNWLLKNRWILELRTSEQYNNRAVFHLNNKVLNYLVLISIRLWTKLYFYDIKMVSN